jgi:2,3-diketo-5-methylthio-1-phosphopentane phosphatase
VLFPFARAHLREHLQNPLNADQLRESIGRLREEWSDDVARGEQPPGSQDPGSAAGAITIMAYVEWLMDRDRKSPGLKMLQGLIWEQGYRAGVLKGEVFSDVPAALRRWREMPLDVAIYSSGSELAQRLIFGNTAYGDLTPLISRFFDTGVGPKIATESYSRIAADLARTPDRMLFVSDVTAELDVATSAGTLATALFWRAVHQGDEPPAMPHVALQVPATRGDLVVVDELLLTAAHDAGMAVHVWTVNDETEMGRLVDLGVDGVISDLPTPLVSLVAARGLAYVP